MENQSKETELRLLDLWDVFKRCWWAMLAVLIVVSALSFVVMNATHQDEYTASLTVYVMQKFDDKSSLNSTAQLYIAEDLMGDVQRLLKSHDQILMPVMKAQNLEGVLTVKQFERMLSIQRVDSGARILTLSITSSSAKRSAEIVNAIGDQAITYFDGIYNKGMISIVDKAVEPQQISNPISYKTILLIGLIAAVVVYAIFLIRFMMDDKINSRDDVEKYLGLNMLGAIPNKHDSNRKKSKNGYYYSYSSDGTKKRVEKEGSAR